ncbi:hypothetical protein ACIQJX_35100 [Streptomyces griseoviridis]
MTNDHTPTLDVTSSRVGLTSRRCDHGSAVVLGLEAIPCCRPLPSTMQIETVVPRCLLAEIIGTVLHHIDRREGPAAVTDFLDQVDTARQAAARTLWTT